MVTPSAQMSTFSSQTATSLASTAPLVTASTGGSATTWAKRTHASTSRSQWADRNALNKVEPLFTGSSATTCPAICQRAECPVRG